MNRPLRLPLPPADEGHPPREPKLVAENPANSNADSPSLHTSQSALYRHGDRTPVAPYPTDPYQNLSYWPTGWGQLTDRGKEQHFILGQWLRKRYNGFLPIKYSKDDIYVRSTDVDRTLMSAQSNLAGLYPLDQTEEWHKGLLWQPIPVHTTPEIEDMVLAAKRPCPRYNQELEAVMKSEEIQSINQQNAKLFEYLSNYSGSKVEDLVSLEYLYDTLHIEDMYHLKLPQWTSGVYPDKMAPLSDLTFTLQALTPTQQRLKSGPLLKEMTSNMERAVHNKTEGLQKMFMYSGHDTTVANFLLTLQVFEVHSPPYTALVLLELRESDSGFTVSVLYRNTSAEPRLLTLPGCEPLCPYEKFIALTKTRIPLNWEEECRLSGIVFQMNTVLIIALTFSAVMLTMLLSSLIYNLVHWRRQKSAGYYYHNINTHEQ